MKIIFRNNIHDSSTKYEMGKEYDLVGNIIDKYYMLADIVKMMDKNLDIVYIMGKINGLNS